MRDGASDLGCRTRHVYVNSMMIAGCFGKRDDQILIGSDPARWSDLLVDERFKVAVVNSQHLLSLVCRAPFTKQ